jgi:epoxyqueuosine reductase QueG
MTTMRITTEIFGKETGQWLVDLIHDFTATSSDNHLGLETGERAFDAPLVGFSSGADPLYDFFKEHIGEFYLSPLDFLEAAYPQQQFLAEQLTVISWVIPSTVRTRKEQAAQSRYPSLRWARTRALGEDFNVVLRNQVTQALQKEGVAAVAPLLSPLWKRMDEGPYAPCSNWSERHAAFTAGLGTFGLCDGLITRVGKAVRVGSVVAAIRLTASERPYTSHQQYCLGARQCGECISRCPVGALSEQGHDKQRCMEYTEHRMNDYCKDHYGLDTYACGLCQAGVPCTYSIPKKKDGSSG